MNSTSGPIDVFHRAARIAVALALMPPAALSYGQTFSNGDFEINTAVVDQINLTNPVFNGFMSNTNAFGTQGNLDIITSSTWGGAGAQNGLWYVALTGGGADIFSMLLTAPLVAGNPYTINFWDRADPGYIPLPIEVGVSNNVASFGTLVYTTPAGATNNVWTQRSFTFNAPVAGQYITLQMQGIVQNWAHLDNFTFSGCALTVDIGNDTTLCNGQGITYDATTATAISYVWQDGSTGTTFNTSTAGQVYVTISDGTCSASDTVDVSTANIAPVDIGADTALCPGATVTFDATTAGATGYAWQNGSGGTTYTTGSAGTVWVTVTSGGCSLSDTAIVSLVPLTPPDLGPDSTLCAGQQIDFDVTSPGAIYLWQDGSSQPTYSTTVAGTIWVTVSFGLCSASDTVQVSVVTLPSLDIGPDTSLCPGTTVTFDATTAGATSYTWQNGSGGPTYIAGSAGTIWVNAYAGNCFVSDTAVVSMTPLVAPDLGPDTAICQGQQIDFDVTSPNAGYLWQDGTSLATFTATVAGTIWVTVSNGACTASDTVVVAVDVLAPPDLGPDSTLCDGETMLLSVTPGNASVLWSDGTGANTLAVETTDTYWVQLDLGNCSERDSIHVEFLPVIEDIDLGHDTIICLHTDLLLDATTPDGTYAWSTGDSSATLLVDRKDTYWVTVTTPCAVVVDTIGVVIEDCSLGLYVPNTFTPDGDGVNEWFQPILTGDVKDYALTIFDRWGEAIFDTDDRYEPWFGDLNGAVVPQGVYVWMIEYASDETGVLKVERLLGHVSLLR